MLKLKAATRSVRILFDSVVSPSSKVSIASTRARADAAVEARRVQTRHFVATKYCCAGSDAAAVGILANSHATPAPSRSA